MLVELLHVADCPGVPLVEQRVTAALRVLGRRDVTLVRRLVSSSEDADRLGFVGSPTLRVDGADPFAVGDEQVGLACRVYPTPAGPEGSPTTEQLVAALR